MTLQDSCTREMVAAACEHVGIALRRIFLLASFGYFAYNFLFFVWPANRFDRAGITEVGAWGPADAAGAAEGSG